MAGRGRCYVESHRRPSRFGSFIHWVAASGSAIITVRPSRDTVLKGGEGMVSTHRASQCCAHRPALTTTDPATRYLACVATILWLLLVALPGLARSEPAAWRLQELPGDASPLRLTGEFRVRYEAIDGQFRALPGLNARDHYLMMRTRLKLESAAGPVGATLELLDSRQYGADVGSVIDRSIVNPLDFLQARLNVDLGRYGEWQAGRMTMDVGSRRLIARNRYRNTINAFDGVSWRWQGAGDIEARAFWTLPVIRLPLDPRRLLDNSPALDQQDIADQFYGAFIDLPVRDATRLELYVYALDEGAVPALSGRIYTPGLRLLRPPAPAALDFEIETALQRGESSLLFEGTNLNHRAWFAHASLGYTFAARWHPRIVLACDYASGDRDPNDGENNRFDTLFGARRFEYGPTGIYGAVARANLSSPEVRLTLEPGARTRLMTALRGVWLAAARDFWLPALLQDPSGAAGRHVGDQIELRLRHELRPTRLRLELGGAYLFAGRFQRDAPGGRGTNTAYGYGQFRWSF
jgi:hypothetical protein